MAYSKVTPSWSVSIKIPARGRALWRALQKNFGSDMIASFLIHSNSIFTAILSVCATERIIKLTVNE
jgi:hypothetical protein